MMDEMIEKKKMRHELSQGEYYMAVDYLLNHGVDGKVVKFFLSLNSFGMTKHEVLYLTLAMRDSGKVLKFNQSVFEKHSTGGIGDATSVVLIPLIASLGYKIIKTTAKSLVFTNGSADRFGAIPNFKVTLTNEEIKQALDGTNACVLSHNGDICPADRLFYKVLEEYGLNNNINFMASTIACKKLASGARMVLVDVKFGYASVIKTYRQAKKMAHLLKYIFNSCGVKSVIVITSTEQTIGCCIGNALEVVDAINVLKGKNCLLRDVSVEYAVEMISSVNKKLSRKDIKDMVNVALDGGVAYDKFISLVQYQGGDVKAVKEGKVFTPYKQVQFYAVKDGYVGNINSLMLGELVRRLCKETHDNNIGVNLKVKIGDLVHTGDEILTFYYKDAKDLRQYAPAIEKCVSFTDVKIKPVKVIKKVIR